MSRSTDGSDNHEIPRKVGKEVLLINDAHISDIAEDLPNISGSPKATWVTLLVDCSLTTRRANPYNVRGLINTRHENVPLVGFWRSDLVPISTRPLTPGLTHKLSDS